MLTIRRNSEKLLEAKDAELREHWYVHGHGGGHEGVTVTHAGGGWHEVSRSSRILGHIYQTGDSRWKWKTQSGHSGEGEPSYEHALGKVVSHTR